MATLKLPKIVSKRKRVGRGIAAGQGKTAGRGTKGQHSRTGSKRRLSKHFLKLPKFRGFKRITPKHLTLGYKSLSLHFKDGDKVSPGALIRLGLANRGELVKIVGPKTDNKKLRFVGVKLTKSVNA